MMNNNIAWYEKYRPKTFAQLLTQDVLSAETMAEENELPNILIIGPPGSGKLTTGYLIADKLLGPCNGVEGFGYFDAHEVGRRDFSTSGISEFSRKILPSITYCPKVCYIANADCLPEKFLKDLHRLWQRYPDAMRIVFSCQEESSTLVRMFQQLFGQLIFRFTPVDPEQSFARLVRICQQENLQWTSDGIRYLVDLTKGNLKLAIAFLQQASMLEVRAEMANFSMIKHLPNPLEMQKLLQLCLKVYTSCAKDMVIGFYLTGQSYEQILKGLQRAITIHNPMSEFIRKKYLEVMDHLSDMLPEQSRYEMNNLRVLMHIFCDISSRWTPRRPGLSSSSSSSSGQSTRAPATRPALAKANSH